MDIFPKALRLATHPRNALDIVRQCIERDVRQVWFRRSSVLAASPSKQERNAKRCGIQCSEGGCPLMYCEPVDGAPAASGGGCGWGGRVLG